MEIHFQFQYMDCLWAQVSKFRADQWQERHIVRPYLAFESSLADALQHNLPTFIVPGHMENYSYPLPRVIFRLFDETDVPNEGPQLPAFHTIDRFLLEWDMHLIMRQNFWERKDW